MTETNQTTDTRAFFNSQAQQWSLEYQNGGHMADRIRRFSDLLETHSVKDGTLLDFGCGSGDIALGLAAQGWTVNACDISPQMIATASGRSDAEAVHWQVLDASTQACLPFADSAFDAVVSSSVFEYVDQPQRPFSEIGRILKPGGIFLLTVPDMRHPVRKAEMTKQRRAHNPFLMALLRHTRWGPTYEYLRLSVNRWPLEQWCELLANAGLTPQPLPECTHPLALLMATR